MKDIEIIKKALKRDNFPPDCSALRISAIGALERVYSLLSEAPKFFSHHDFDGEKLDWLKRAGLINKKE